jgi:glucose/mannose-6-phosphate isomerase
VLDDLQFVSSLDKGNALGIIAGQPAQLKQVLELGHIDRTREIESIILAGMGGSALAGEFVRSWKSDKLNLPFVISRDYRIPAFVGKKTLAIISSYSGNTEEVIESYAQAKAAGADIITMSSGGKLQQLAEADGLPHVTLPSGYQPRLAVFFEVRAVANLLEHLGLLKGAVDELEAAADWVTPLLSDWSAEVNTDKNQAKQIARELLGSPVVVYAGSTLAYPAMKWKIDFNENAKNLAFYYHWPEFNHNEFLGWLHPQMTTMLRVVELESDLDHLHLKKRFDISNRLLSGRMPNPIRVQAEGDTGLKQMLWTTLLGDFTSAYLAFLNGIDPTPVELIEKLKKELAK